MEILLVSMTTHGVLEYLDSLKESISKTLEEVGVTAEVVPWPGVFKPSLKCFDWDRGQYVAQCLIDQLDKHFVIFRASRRVLILGIGYMDGYEYGLNFVFGEAVPSRGIAVVFTKRLRTEFYGEPPDPSKYLERLSKEAVHELGHLLGLKHCSNKSCVMRFSNNIMEVDEKTERFCNQCAGMVKTHISSTK
ncbi:MAG: archaemetzincin family Zn-dependent metalloprotease [Thermosphaera sp.]